MRRFEAWLDLLFRVLIVCAIILVMWAILRIEGRRDDMEQRQYCVNVADGVWPDYRHSFKEECGGQDPPKFNEDLTK